MTVKILYDNSVFQAGLRADWGFSCLVEAHGRALLFATGASGSLLLENMKKLHVEAKSIDEVFISHPHYDHIGGLSAFLNENPNVKVYVPVSLKGIRHARETVSVAEPMELHEGFISTGELKRIEQSLIVKTPAGLVLIVGCSHPEISRIFGVASRYGKIHAVIGGLHGFDEFHLLENLGMVCPTHCTQFIAEIRSRYPEKCVEGGVGKVIEI
jgi:7,8-dihydropterin-6-yl-methyl-4-(beta-D-ribofuranosyl)aminobenzene 5'-phosphate synthase